MKSLDLLVVQCGRKVAECRDQLVDGIGRLLPGHSTPAITGGHDDRRPASRVGRGAAPPPKAPLGGSESRLLAAGNRRAGCDRVSCPACQYVRMARLWASEHRVPSSMQLHSRGVGSRVAGQDRVYKQCSCAPHFADRSASLDTWLERTSRTIPASAVADCPTSGRAAQQDGCEAPQCRCVEVEQRRRALQRSKSLREVPLVEHREAWADGTEKPRGLGGDGAAGSKAVMGATWRQDLKAQEAGGAAATLAHPAPQRLCRHALTEAGHAAYRAGDARQIASPSSAFQPVTNSTPAGHNCSLQAKQYHAVGYPPMPLAAPVACHLPLTPRPPGALSAAEAQRHHIDHEMATRFLLGRSATVDVLEESLGGGDVAAGGTEGGCGCLAGPRPPLDGHLPAAGWRPRVKSISDPNIPLNVADGGPAAEESNKSLGRAGGTRPPPPTRTKRTEIYMELRPARGGAAGTAWEDLSEEEHSTSMSSSKAASSSGRQSPLGYAADCLAPTPASSCPSSSRGSSQDSLSAPELADAATQTPAPATRCPLRSTMTHGPPTSRPGPATPPSPNRAEVVPPTYWEAAEDVGGALGPQQAWAGPCEAPQQQQQQQQYLHEYQRLHHHHYHLQHHLQRCTCRKVRREAADPSTPRPRPPRACKHYPAPLRLSLCLWKEWGGP